ncbi:YkvA family protein [Aquiflexum gelatinilyticum]|uniref:YkvA family protein n=1 Tax=Aquiflexum gelatinilyticum TaxID=2961943 RepID=A0A9X2P215_9BACT|nr:YkvA family protein [Aquiflexum gelatinilyticum]MCR9014021.1 YkvA family protein [Aquiflexum gelatinilyticum]
MASLREKTVDFFGKAKLLYLEKANDIAGEDGKLQKLLKNVGERLNAVSQNPKVQTALEPIMIFKRMIQAHRSGKFKVSSKTLGLIVLGLVYFVTPIDIIPDFMPILGFTDDLSVILAVFNSVKHEVEDFLNWEKTKP